MLIEKCHQIFQTFLSVIFTFLSIPRGWGGMVFPESIWLIRGDKVLWYENLLDICRSSPMLTFWPCSHRSSSFPSQCLLNVKCQISVFLVADSNSSKSCCPSLSPSLKEKKDKQLWAIKPKIWNISQHAVPKGPTASSSSSSSSIKKQIYSQLEDFQPCSQHNSVILYRV